MPDISIIIVNYKGWIRLKQCLDSLKLITDNRFSHEVIIIDNFSNDGQLEVFIELYPAFTFIVNSGNLGFANGCNLGASKSQGSFLLFLNPDTIITADALFSLFKETLTRKKFSVISCGLVNENGYKERLNRKFISVFTVTGWLRALNRLVHRQKERLFFQSGDYLYPDWVSGSVIMISRESFIELGGWDEDFWMYYEDVDLCRRAKLRMGEIVILKNTSIEHNHGGSSRINLQTTALTKTEVNISRHIYVSKHETGWRALFMHLILILDNMVFGLPVAIAGTLFFFIRRLNIKSRVYFKLANFYLERINSNTWLSKRSVNYNRKSLNIHLMNVIQSLLFRIIVPKFIRKKIVAKVLRANVLKYYAGISEPLAEDINPVLDYLSKNPVAIFPYDFQDQYRAEDIEVFEDTGKGLRYVILDGKRLYFKKRWSKKRIRKNFNELSKEQDPRSPHCYITDNFRVDKGDVIVDIGAAEGNFALTHIENASRVVLFESNKEWLEPLQATFEPWKDKVMIVNKFAGDICNSKCTTLDSFFQPDEKISFLKIDVEGAESRLFDGCKRILQEQRFLKVAVCTYHKPQDEKEFTQLLTQYGFETSHSDGYMLFITDKKIKPPYLRRGLIRAIKTGHA